MINIGPALTLKPSVMSQIMLVGLLRHFFAWKKGNVTLSADECEKQPPTVKLCTYCTASDTVKLQPSTVGARRKTLSWLWWEFQSIFDFSDLRPWLFVSLSLTQCTWVDINWKRDAGHRKRRPLVVRLLSQLLVYFCHISWPKFPLFTGICRTSRRGIQCLFWWHCLPVFIQSEAYYHNSEVNQDTSHLIGYHDNQSGSAPSGALYPVAQQCPAFNAWEYWESVWDARERWQDSPALQTRMDVESILSARGIHRKWPSIRRQGNVSKHIVCGLIIERFKLVEVVLDVIGWRQMGWQKSGGYRLS